MHSRLRIDLASATPIHLQIEQQVLRLAAGGALPPGAPMPSVREVALELGVNKATVSKAYQRLTERGALVRVRGQVLRVAEDRAHAADDEQRLSGVDALMRTLASHAAELDLPAQLVLQRLQALLSAEMSASKAHPHITSAAMRLPSQPPEGFSCEPDNSGPLL